MDARARIKLPKQFLEKDGAKATRMIAARLVTFVGPYAAIIALWGFGTLPLAANIALTVLLAAVGAVGLHGLALIGHDGGHFNLHTDRLTSARIGVLASALVPMHFDAGFALSHASHHRYTNTERDPDLALFSPYASFFSRLVLARLKASRAYLKQTLALAFKPINADDLLSASLTPADWRGLARLNLAASAGALIAYGVAMAVLGSPAVIAFTAIYVATIALSGIRPFLEHIDTGTARGSNARTWSSPLLDWVFGGINYHLTHHLYPGVPAYNLKAAHAWLVDAQAIDVEVAPIVVGLRQSAAVLRSGKRYGPA